MEKIKYITLLFSILLFTQCELKYEDFKPLEGEADFSKFVAIGDSYTAGYTDGALGRRGQVNSFSYILSEQLKYVGSEGFNQPLVASDGSIGTTEIQPGVLNSYFELKLINGDLQPVPGVGDVSILADRLYDESKPFRNFGVPGAKSSHLVAPGYAQFNPFFARFASSNTTSVLQDALAANPTFVSLWIGGNDVLTYALAGGDDDEITDPVLFETYMNLITSNLFGNEKEGVIGNIPDIIDLPYFSYISYNALVLDQEKVDLLNAAYEPYNAISDAYGFDRIDFVVGANAFVIEDENTSHPAKIRQIKEGEKILLSASSGITNPEMG